MSEAGSERENSAVVTVEQPAQLPEPAQAPDEGATVMAIIAKAAADPNVDVVKLEKLIDLQERVLARNAKNAYSAALVLMRPRLPKVLRSKKNDQTKSKYAPLEDINTQIDPILHEFGFATSTKIVAQTDRSVTVRAELWHKMGHIEETQIEMPLDDRGSQGTVNKTGPHATSSSVTYGKRVSICALLNISTGDDVDGNAPRSLTTLTVEQAAQLDLMLNEVKADRPQFLKYMGVDSVLNIKPVDYQKALNAIKAKEKKNATKPAA